MPRCRMTAILISRFLLRLQAANHKASNPQHTTITSLHDGDALVFERSLDSLGLSSLVVSRENGCEDSFDKDGDRDVRAIQAGDVPVTDDNLNVPRSFVGSDSESVSGLDRWHGISASSLQRESDTEIERSSTVEVIESKRLARSNGSEWV